MKRIYPFYYSDRCRFSKGQRRAFKSHIKRCLTKARTENKKGNYITPKPVSQAWRQW